MTTRKPNRDELADLCRSAVLTRGPDFDFSPILELRHKGIAFTLAANDDRRLELLTAVRAGEPVELEVDIRVFQQQDGVSNRNFIRFKKSTLRKFAKSFKGVPLQRDHDRSLAARAGTIIASDAVKIEGGLAFDQTARITAPFAVEAVLSGNLDRFSIGPSFPGLDTVECSECKCPVFTGDCFHLPGDKLEDGSRVEFIFTEVEGVEVSAVSVPAVKGTGLDRIRSALAAGLDNYRDESAEDHNMKNIAKNLGLKDDADESTIAAALGALKARAESAESSLATSRATHEETLAELGKLTARVAELDADGQERDINSLCTEFAGTFPPNRDAKGELTLDPGPLEVQVRELAKKDLDAARAMLEAMPSQLPELGATPRSIATRDATPAIAVPLSAYGNSENAKAQRAKLGISEEDFSKYNSHDGTETEHLRGDN